MSIDWITVAAQIANFLVLVWLLRRFLYRPILDGIDAREAEITTRMQEAVLAKEKARAAEAEYLDQTRALHAQQADMAQAVRREAEAQRDTLLAEARARMDKEHEAWATHLDEEARKYTAKLHATGGEALLSLTAKALSELADDTLEGRMAQHLAHRIAPMADDLRLAAGEARQAVVTSRSPLPPAAQDAVREGVHAVFPPAEIRFETDPDQPLGLTLRIGGAQVDWTVDAYLDSLRDRMDDRLTDRAQKAAQ